VGHINVTIANVLLHSPLNIGYRRTLSEKKWEALLHLVERLIKDVQINSHGVWLRRVCCRLSQCMLISWMSTRYLSQCLSSGRTSTCLFPLKLMTNWYNYIIVCMCFN
jgi:LPS sulfotransferase NodH